MNKFFFYKNKKILTHLKFTFFILVFIFFTKYNLKAQKEELGVIHQYHDRGYWMDFNDAPNSLYRHLSKQAFDLLARRSAEINKISSLSDWQARQKRVKETLLDIMGPFPEKTPLNAKITRIVKKEDYRIEHIVFESRPGFYVTSSLFIPNGLKRGSKNPVIIYCSGHWDEGYHNPDAHHEILNFVKKRFIVFAFDPVGQGERIQYFDPNTSKSMIGGATAEHTHPGAQVFISGSSQASYMAWDGIRAVDYLLTRKDIDPERIGITGWSGGGTQTSYIAALDERIKAAAPGYFITNITRLIQSIGPQDAEQNLYNGVYRGIDHADLLAVRAPKPVLMITTTRDIFNIQGARETAREVSRIYKAYGMESNFNMVEDDAYHELTKKNKETMYAFFQKHLNNPGSPEDIQIEPVSIDDIQVTRTGQVSTSFGGETVFSLNSNETGKLMDKLQESRTDIDRHLAGVLNSARILSGFQISQTVQEPVFTGRYQRDGYVLEKYYIKGEGDYVIPYLLMKPSSPSNKALIYLHPSGKSVEAMVNGEMEWFVSQGLIVLAPDLLGLGETGFDYNFWHNMTRWHLSVLIGRSIAGIRAGDLVQLIHLLQENKEIEEIYALAKKELSPVLLHAAAFEPSISRIALVEPYSSYRSVVQARFYNTEFITGAVPGALKSYDLPDLAASLAPRKLMMLGVTDGSGNIEDMDVINKDISFIKDVYKSKNNINRLYITTEKPVEKPYNMYLEWLK